MASRNSEPSASSSADEDDLDLVAADKASGSVSDKSDDDGWETCESDSDSIPDPDEIMRMTESGDFDWKRVSKVAKGPRCWKCFDFSPYFKCENCTRSFHRKCVLMDDGFPDPIFDKSLSKALKAKYKKVQLKKCAICIVSEETQVPTFSNMTQEELNKVFFIIARYTHAEFGIDILPEIKTKGITTADIMDKTSRGEYKTVEGFYNDYRWIQYSIIKKYAVESEENDVAKTLLNLVELHLHVMLACVDCLEHYFNANGRPYNVKDYSLVLRKPCSEPHAVVWIKEGNFPFWPAKVLAHDPIKQFILIRFFGERAIGKKFTYPTDDMIFRTYSLVFPERKPKKFEYKWTQACAECNEYTKNLREMYGKEGVVIPQNSEKFDLDLEKYKRRMFQLFAFKNELTGDVADDHYQEDDNEA